MSRRFKNILQNKLYKADPPEKRASEFQIKLKRDTTPSAKSTFVADSLLFDIQYYTILFVMIYSLKKKSFLRVNIRPMLSIRKQKKSAEDNRK